VHHPRQEPSAHSIKQNIMAAPAPKNGIDWLDEALKPKGKKAKGKKPKGKKAKGKKAEPGV
jgi:hypothetical protein